METIKSYLENMFLNLPKTEEIERLKNEMLINMEEKYLELKKEGKMEHEAIGIVISEFGNIEELLDEMNIKTDRDVKNNEKESYPQISFDEAKEYILLKKQGSKRVGLGVGIILFGVSVLLFLIQLLENPKVMPNLIGDARDIVPVVIFFLFLVPAVGLFVYNGMRLEAFKNIEEGKFELRKEGKVVLEKEYMTLSSAGNGYVILGICLCVFSPVNVFIATMIREDFAVYGVSALIIMVAVAVNILIRAGSIRDTYKRLLKLEEYSESQKEKRKVINIVASIIWPLATAIFSLLGFVFNLWHINWVVYVITGIFFGAFSMVYNMVKSE